MWDVFRTVLCSVLSALKTERDLALENLAFRISWQTVLTLVQPATVERGEVMNACGWVLDTDNSLLFDEGLTLS